MYDFRKMSDKDVFQAKLKHDVIDFGHIKFWQRKSFQRFCLKHEFVARVDGWMDHVAVVKHKFAYRYSYNHALHLPFASFGLILSEIIGKPVLGTDYDTVLVERNPRKKREYDYVILRSDGSFSI